MLVIGGQIDEFMASGKRGFLVQRNSSSDYDKTFVVFLFRIVENCKSALSEKISPQAHSQW